MEKIIKPIIGTVLLVVLTYGAYSFREHKLNAIGEHYQAKAVELQERAKISAENAKQQSELKRLDLEAKKAESELALLQAKKRNSPECQFWLLQKKNGHSDKADEKIKSYCNIN